MHSMQRSQKCLFIAALSCLLPCWTGATPSDSKIMQSITAQRIEAQVQNGSQHQPDILLLLAACTHV